MIARFCPACCPYLNNGGGPLSLEVAYCDDHRSEAELEAARRAEARYREALKVRERFFRTESDNFVWTGGERLGTSDLPPRPIRGPEGLVDFQREATRIARERRRILEIMGGEENGRTTP